MRPFDIEGHVPRDRTVQAVRFQTVPRPSRLNAAAKEEATVALAVTLTYELWATTYSVNPAAHDRTRRCTIPHVRNALCGEGFSDKKRPTRLPHAGSGFLIRCEEGRREEDHHECQECHFGNVLHHQTSLSLEVFPENREDQESCLEKGPAKAMATSSIRHRGGILRTSDFASAIVPQ